jgi:hypothetical protein
VIFSFFFSSIFFPQTDDEFGEKTVSILLDGEESEMIFIDHPTVEMSVSTEDFGTCQFNIYKKLTKI